MMTIKNTKAIIEIAEVLNSAAVYTEQELAGRLTSYNGTTWDSIWIPQAIINKAMDKRGNLSLYDLGLELVKAGYACIDKIRFDRVDAHGFVYTLYQLPTQGMAAQNQGGIRFMSNVEEFSEFFEDEDTENLATA